MPETADAPSATALQRPPPTGGHPCVYHGKLRRPYTFTLTEEATRLMEHDLARTGLSRGDYLEALIRRHGRAIDPRLLP
jgi:hypothetical protein